MGGCGVAGLLPPTRNVEKCLLNDGRSHIKAINMERLAVGAAGAGILLILKEELSLLQPTSLVEDAYSSYRQ